MRYGSGKGRFGADGGSGVVFDGMVTLDKRRGRLVLVDEDGDAYDIADDLSRLEGRLVRVTLIDHESITRIQRAVERSQVPEELPAGHSPVGEPRARTRSTG